jgi:ElaB/YqjD/DUF883 family membrane-anchored ribosome-binding protein
MEKIKNDLIKTVSSISHDLNALSTNTEKKIDVLADDISDSTKEMYLAGQRYVQKNPKEGIAMAIGLGVLTGSLLTLAFQNAKKSKR